MEIIVPEALKKLASLAPCNIYITGGYIRNQLCGFGSTDIDLCGPLVATALNLPSNYSVTTINYRLGTALIKCGKDKFEYTPFRVETYPKDGSHSPSNIVFTSDINKDAQRRDFTCGSLYYNIKTDELIDLVGGVKDIENKIIRSKNPEQMFSADGLRLMRLVRIASETGFKIESATATAALKFSHLLRDISPERKVQELNKILIADTTYGIEGAHYRGLKLLHKLKLIPYIVPELCQAEGVEQNPLYHKYDVLEHIFQTVRFSHPSIRLAALFHDIGKPYCQKKYGNMHGHERASENTARARLGAFGLKYPNEVIDEVARLCLYHMYDLNGNTSENKIRLFIAKNYDIIDKLILLIEADRRGSGIREVPPVHRFTQIKQKMIDDGCPVNLKDLKINGSDIYELGGRGESIGIILRDVHEKCVIDPTLNNDKWLNSYVLKHIKLLKEKNKA